MQFFKRLNLISEMSAESDEDHPSILKSLALPVSVCVGVLLAGLPRPNWMFTVGAWIGVAVLYALRHWKMVQQNGS